MSPFGLGEGLRLERSGCTLPWGAAFERLREAGEPELTGKGTRRLLWQAERCLGGIACDVAVFENEHQIGKPFSSAQLWLALDAEYRTARSPEDYARVCEKGVGELAQRFGEPDRYVEGPEPLAEWYVGPVLVWRFVSDKNGPIWETKVFFEPVWHEKWRTARAV